MKVSIIIINYNTPKLVYDCLSSIVKNLDRRHYEIIVVDNGSHQRVEQKKIESITQAKYIFSKKNLGFGGGNNLGAKYAKEELLWFLNSDTIVPDNSIEKLFDLLLSCQRVAIASPVLFNDLKQNYVQGDFYANFQNLRTVLTRKAKSSIPENEQGYFETDVVVGASLIIKRQVFERLAGFDQNIFMFFDDDDLCLRARKLGYKTIVYKKARIIHLQGRSINKNNLRKKLYYKSQNYFWQKHYGFWLTLAMRLIRLPYRLYRSITGESLPAQERVSRRFGIDIREVAGKKAGKGYYVYELVNHLAKIDHQNEYYLYTHKNLDWYLPENFITKVIPGPFISWHQHLRKALREDDVDSFLATLSYTSAILSPVPTVLVVHDLAVFYAPVKSRRKSSILEKLTLDWAAKKAKKILVTSLATRSELLRYNTELKNKIEITTLAVSDRFHPRHAREIAQVLKRYNLTDKSILFVGTIEPRKNIVLLIRAYAQLPAQLQQKHPLIIVGQKGWYYEEVFATISRLGLDKKVRFLDYVNNDDLPLIYNCASLFVYPSVYEGFGLPVLEAIKSGVPTIISDAKALVEVGGKATTIAKLGDPKALAAKMAKILTEKSLRKSMIERGLAHASKYDWRTTAEKTLASLKSAQEN